MNNSYLSERITKTKALIEAYEDAMLQLGSGAVASYVIDTGQTKQSVTKTDLSMINNTLASLYNRLCTMEARLNGSGSITVTPAW